MGVVNVQLKIKAQRIKFITRLLNAEWEGLWKSLAEHFLGKYKHLNINTHILKCKIINKKLNVQYIPNIYREMLIAWTDLDLSRDTGSVQQILHEPLHGNVNIPQNIKTSTLIGFQINLVQDIWDLNTNDFKPFVGLITNGIFRRHYNQIKDNFPRQWLRILNNEDPYYGELDTIFLLQNDNILTDVQNATAKELYTAILTKTNTEVLCKAKWEHVFGDKIIWKNIWKTIHSGLIDNWDLNIIYKLIHQVIAVRKNLYHWRIAPTPECLECSDVDSVLHAFFYCTKTNNFIKQAEPIFKKPFGDNFKLNVYSMVFGPTHKIGNNASKLGIFLWSKIIKTIWICRKLLEESKPCNEMEIFKTFVKQRIEMEHFVVSENDGKRENFLSYWCYEGILATCTDAFEVKFCL